MNKGLRLTKAAPNTSCTTAKALSEVIKLLRARSNFPCLNFIRTLEKESLDEAMRCLGIAMTLKPRDLLFNMDGRHLERFKYFNKTNELDLIESLKHYHRDVQLLLPDHFNHGRFLHYLAMTFLERYERFVEAADLTIAFV